MLISGLAKKEKQRLIKIAPRLEGRIVAKGFEFEEDEEKEDKEKEFPEQIVKAEKDLVERHEK